MRAQFLFFFLKKFFCAEFLLSESFREKGVTGVCMNGATQGRVHLVSDHSVVSSAVGGKAARK